MHSLVSAAASPSAPNCLAILPCPFSHFTYHACQALVSLSSPEFVFPDFFALVSIASSCFLPSSSPPATGSLFRPILRSPHPGQKTFLHSPTPSMLLCPQICPAPPSSELRTVVGAISPMGLFSSPSTYLTGNI